MFLCAVFALAVAANALAAQTTADPVYVAISNGWMGLYAHEDEYAKFSMRGKEIKLQDAHHILLKPGLGMMVSFADKAEFGGGANLLENHAKWELSYWRSNADRAEANDHHMVTDPSDPATAERLLLFGRDIRSLGKAGRRALLGRSLAIVYQDPMSSLNPALRVGRQLGEVAELHGRLSRKESHRRSIDRLRDVRIGSPESRVRQYPHEFSGGMRQRAVIAMGLMIDPKILIADEPTTALDVTVQQQILRLLRDVGESRPAATLFISHDVAVVSQLCSRVVVMYAGRVVEELDVATLVRGPAHPYTAALLASVPTMESDRSQPLATIPGRAPGPFDESPGCPFASRCPLATDRCASERPELETLAPDQRVACWHPLTGDEERERVVRARENVVV